MIGLTRLTSSASRHRCRQRQHGILSCAATAWLPSGSHRHNLPDAKGQHPVGLIAGHNSLQAIEAALVELSPFLSTSAAIAVLIDSREIGAGLRIRGKLEQMGFRIEAGVRCQEGFVLSAIRHGFGQMEKAA